MPLGRLLKEFWYEDECEGLELGPFGRSASHIGRKVGRQPVDSSEYLAWQCGKTIKLRTLSYLK